MDSEQTSQPLNGRDDSDELLRLFQAQKAQDESRAPSFAMVWSAARARRGRERAPERNLRLRWTLGGALAAAACAVALGLLLMHQIPEIAGQGSDSQGISLVRWESPTAALLDSYGPRAPEVEIVRLGASAPERSLSTWKSPTAYLETAPVAARSSYGDDRSKRWSWHRERQGWNL